MAAYNKFQQFVEDLGKKVHNLDTDSLKIALSNSAPAATNSVLADITEISYTNASTTSGTGAASRVIQGQDFEHTTGTAKLTATDMVITASGGTVGAFRYVVLYNDTPTSPADPLIGWWDYGSSITLADGETFTIDFDGTNGILTIA